MIRFFTFSQYHNKPNTGSTRIRVNNLLKYWPEAGIYKYGENPQALIFQKVYVTDDYKFPVHFKGVKILDICDSDWMSPNEVLIKQTVDAMDGVTCPTENMATFIRQLTDKPVKVIPDRHIVEGTPKPKKHEGKATKVVWYGYKQNAELLRFAIPTLERLGLTLTVISNEDPMAHRWADDPEKYMRKYYFVKYNSDVIISELQHHDICMLPQGTRPQDHFKSDNKTTLAWLAGLPVATTGDELREFINPVTRQENVNQKHKFAKENYDVKISVRELKNFISELANSDHSPTA